MKVHFSGYASYSHNLFVQCHGSKDFETVILSTFSSFRCIPYSRHYLVPLTNNVISGSRPVLKAFMYESLFNLYVYNLQADLLSVARSIRPRHWKLFTADSPSSLVES